MTWDWMTFFAGITAAAAIIALINSLFRCMYFSRTDGEILQEKQRRTDADMKTLFVKIDDIHRYIMGNNT